MSDAPLARLAGLAADLFDVPVALLWRVDPESSQLEAAVGLAAADLPAAFPPPDAGAAPWTVPDAAADPDLRDHPLVSGPAGIRFVAGVPILSGEGRLLGLLCVMDRVARPAPASRALDRLAALAGTAADLMARTGTEPSDLLADLSHELRTPLAGMLGFVDLLRRDGALDAERLLTLERIEDAGRSLLDLVEDALDIARHGAVRLKPRPFSVWRLIEDAVALVRPEAIRKGLPLLLDLPTETVGPLVGDPDRLRQVLLNLLSNAIKFTEAGAVRVSLTVSPAPAGAPVPLRISVADSGIGVAPEAIPRLFRRFAQADGSVSRRFGGTGLGLAISKRLVEAMRGTIAVESSPGEGSCFSVALTLARAIDRRPLPPPRRPRHPMPRVALLRDALKGRRLLLAEDVPLNQKLVLQMLAPLGAEIDVVADGTAAVAAVTLRDYALVLMDMEMPGMGGLDATRRIRALGGVAAAVPIVALTANAYPEQLDLCREAGMDDHLTKPFGADRLAAVALRWAHRLTSAERG